MSGSSLPPPPKAISGSSQQESEDEQVATTKIDIVFGLLVMVAMIGTVFVWFEVDFINNHPTANNFVNSGLKDLGAIAFTCSLAVLGFALSVCPNFFIPATHGGSLKRFSLFLMMNYVDQLLCITRYLFKYWNSALQNRTYTDELNTLRCGCVLVLVALFAAFSIAFLVPRSLLVRGTMMDVASAKIRILSLKGAISLLTSILLLLGSFLQWSIKEPCDFSSPGVTGEYVYLKIASGFLLGVLLVTTILQDDKGTQDVLLFFIVSQIITTFPNSTGDDETVTTKTSSKKLATAENWLFYIATVFYLLGMMIWRAKVYVAQKAIDIGGEDATTIKSRAKQRSVILSFFLTLLALISMIMMVVWSKKDIAKSSAQQRQADYVACVGFYLVLKSFIGQLLGFKISYLQTVSLMMSFQVVPALGAYVVTSVQNVNQTSYFRAGAILQILCISLAQFVSLANIPKKRIDQFLTQPEEDGAPSRQAGPSSTVVFFLWSLAACYSWQQTTVLTWTVYDVGQVIFPVVIIVGTLDLFGRSNAEVHRVLYLQCMAMITNAALWPILNDAGPTFGKVFILLASCITVGLYSWFNPQDYLTGFHGQAEYPDDQLAVRLADNKEGWERQGRGSAGPSESTSLLATA